MVYDKLIKNKYNISTGIYKYKFTNENISVFLSHFDILNMYPLFPTPQQYDISYKNNITTKHILNILNNNNDYKKYDDILQNTNNMQTLLKNKMDEFNDITVNVNKKNMDQAKIRYFFSYEVIDHVQKNFDAEYVTNAWLKCYEIITLFKLIPQNDTINYFGICEQPGAFLYAINHFIKTKINKNVKFDFILESLNPSLDKKIFKAERELFTEYKHVYDYGDDNTGDVTHLNNIRYYREKYYQKNFDILTADCGLDCSDDFSAQEHNLVKVILGQFLVAISLASKGTNYFFKLFSIYEILTIEIVELARLFFESVHIVRALKTKITSGEIYCVCKNFRFDKKDTDQVLEKLYNIFANINDNTSIMLAIDKDFLNDLIHINKTILYSRLLSLNFLYFRYNNLDYVLNVPDVKTYIQKMIQHYTQYFCDYYDIKKLDQKNKLVKKKFVSKW
ncbi:FtsJ-like methyltransferase [Hokovirus HKV1]|uniref:FtsJ-like methyltransferase n=1 Tax=Hokovirus HKV1 TaxID=1977638 RepID=A0A1V0SGD2_9VIRU|nr:FtsJ-like methyltransferase [Hokovirus HKV1]